jgi:hypothetical protein
MGLAWANGNELATRSLGFPAMVRTCYTLDMAEELTKEEAERRAGDLAHRLMSKPPQPQEWPKKEAPKEAPARASKPRKRGRAGGAS